VFYGDRFPYKTRRYSILIWMRRMYERSITCMLTNERSDGKREACAIIGNWKFSPTHGPSSIGGRVRIVVVVAASATVPITVVRVRPSVIRRLVVSVFYCFVFISSAYVLFLNFLFKTFCLLYRILFPRRKLMPLSYLSRQHDTTWVSNVAPR